MDKKELVLLLNHIQGVGWQSIAKVMQLHNPEDIFKMNGLELSVKTGISYELAEKIQNQSYIAVSDLENRRRDWKKKGINAITYFDDEYPSQLKEISNPPWVIYTKGDMDLLYGPSIAIVGTRNPTPYGVGVAGKLTKELSNYGWTIISGLARGIDKVAHESCIKSDGKTIAVLGSGIDEIYPKENTYLYHQIGQKGLLISEYVPGTLPRPGYFPQRNRIISGLSYGTIIIEASLKSGSLITAKHALDQSRDVFAIPGPITSKESMGTNLLIKQGAKPVSDVIDVMEEYPYLSLKKIEEKETITNLNITEQNIFNAIGIEATYIDLVIESANVSFSEAYDALLSLQLKSLIKQLPGSFYIRT